MAINKSLFGAIDARGEIEVLPEGLGLIAQYARKKLTNDDIYVFPVVLCDNEVDRDGERFTLGALKTLAELFPGKTGIFDHSARARDQVMRCFSANVVTDEVRETSQGEPYTTLRAWVYMLRLDKNANLIAEIDAGIKKEVSLSCAVANVTCSICGKPHGREGCEHRKGREYDQKKCVALLENPTDAYEFSFVAVPAQPAAGVTKSKTPAADAAEHNEEEGPILTEQEIRAKYPDAVKAIEAAARAAADEEARKSAVEAERARLKGIDQVAGKIHDAELVDKAKYGETTMTAQELSFAYLSAMEDDGAAALKAMKKAGEKTKGVTAAGNAGALPTDGAAPTEDDLRAAGADAAKAYIEAIGGKKNG